MADENGLLAQRAADLIKEYEAVIERLADPAIGSDRSEFLALSRRHKELAPIAESSRQFLGALEDLDSARALIEEATPNDRASVREILDEAKDRAEEYGKRLRELLVPRDPNDDKGVVVEIRGAEGGEEANLFARDLFGMYQRYAERMNWKLETLFLSESERGGLDHAAFLVRGPLAWSRLRHEAGTHRVQRVPVTESQGRIHTSSATVVVLPEADETEIEIDPNDIEIDVYRSTGPGGQSVNTTDSAVRLTHKPSGLVVTVQDEKSQLQNKIKAMQVLRARLADIERQRQEAEMSKTRRDQIGAGGRADKIRTYNFRDNRVTDHRIGLTLKKLDRVLFSGELDELSDALVAEAATRQMAGQDLG